jgi:hypothetical protein
LERRTVLVAAAVILGAAFVTFAVIALTGRDGGQSLLPSARPTASPSSSPSPSPSASASHSDEPSPSATPSEPSGPLEVAWEPVSEFGSRGIIEDLSFINGRWFALGYVDPDAAIWMSDDGRSWTQSQIDAIDRENERVVATRLAAIDGTLVAIGRFGAFSTDQMAWVTWTSNDGGATWTESRDETMFAPHAIVAGGPGLVAAGWEYAGTVPFDSWVAVSEDGIAWELLPTTLANTQISSLAMIGERIVAVGSLADEFERRPVVWYSDDGGSSWTAAEIRDSESPETMTDVIVTDDGLLAVGPGDGAHGGGAAWLSTDGTEWERFTIDAVAGAKAVASVDGGFVAVGNVRDELDIGAEFTWTSVDGRTWEAGREIDPGTVIVNGIGSDGSTVVAGGRCVGDVCDHVLWIGEVTR